MTTKITTKSASEIRDDILRVIRNGLIARGVANPNVTKNSDEYVRAQSVANELEVLHANALIAADQLMDDTATGENLDRLAAIVGLSRRAASGSTGFVVVAKATAASTVVSGTQLIDASGLRYQVTAGGTYNNGDYIPIASIDTGPETNLPAGSILQWAGGAPGFLAPTIEVAAGGLVNGSAADTDEELRARLIARKQTPPASGNWQDMVEWAETSHPAVQKAFAYPAIQGPATVHIAVTASPALHNKSRMVDSTILASYVATYVKGKTPEHVDVTVTTVAEQNADVAIALSLPAAPTSSPPGPGGGWIDASPWPSYAATGYCDVGTVTSSTVFQVRADTAPIAGATRIAWVRPYVDGSELDWMLYTATVLSYTGPSGNMYTVTIDKPFPGISTGCFVWPQCTRQQAYVDAVLDHFALMGPGEKTSNASALIRGFRHPVPSTAYPYSLDAKLLRSLSDAGEEVLDASYNYRSITTPSVPASLTSAPNILIPRHIGFYKA
jgi:uncharacterized phage protein gp47/JayE